MAFGFDATILSSARAGPVGWVRCCSQFCSVRTIREAAQISQSQFAKLIGVNLRTLQNWEQHRTGPARALLKIVASNPKAIEALHG